MNLQQTPPEPYFTCPHCLTKIETINETLKTDEKAQEIPFDSKEKLESNEPAACHYHPGYLSERTQKEQIPDDCLVCKDIVECMLRKMRA